MMKTKMNGKGREKGRQRGGLLVGQTLSNFSVVGPAIKVTPPSGHHLTSRHILLVYILSGVVTTLLSLHWATLG